MQHLSVPLREATLSAVPERQGQGPLFPFAQTWESMELTELEGV